MAEAVLGDARFVAFAATRDVESARTFYVGLLGLLVKEETDYALVLDANGVELRLQKVDAVEPSPYTCLGWRVGSIRDCVKKLVMCGVMMERYDSLEQDADGIWQSPSDALIAWFRDPDGNLISLTEMEKIS